MDTDNPYSGMFSEEDLAKFNALWGRRFVRVDPETKKPHANSKDRFWEVEHMYPAVSVNGNMTAPKMEIVVQPYWRNKTHTAQLPDGKGGASGTTVRHDAIHQVNSKGELEAPGFVRLEYDNFVKQFVEDR